MSYCELLYGEIDDVFNLLKIIKIYINPSDYEFIDFGSGYGKIVNYYSNFFIKSIGIELVKDRYDKALLCKENNNAFFINDNFFNTKLSDKFVLLVNNLALKEGTNKRLSNKILKEGKNNNVVIVTKKLNLLKDKFKNFYELNCSWGKSEIFIYIL